MRLAVSELARSQLAFLAGQCRGIYAAAGAELGADLHGHSVLDLCADQLSHVPLATLAEAIVVSGIYVEANDRIRQTIVDNYLRFATRGENEHAR